MCSHHGLWPTPTTWIACCPTSEPEGSRSGTDFEPPSLRLRHLLHQPLLRLKQDPLRRQRRNTVWPEPPNAAYILLMCVSLASLCSPIVIDPFELDLYLRDERNQLQPPSCCVGIPVLNGESFLVASPFASVLGALVPCFQ